MTAPIDISPEAVRDWLNTLALFEKTYTDRGEVATAAVARDSQTLIRALSTALTASEKRAAEYEAAFKDSNASFQIVFAGCGERNTLLRDLRSYVLVHGGDKDMAPLIERIDQMVKV